ncbi:MAG: MATE family efflux transporter [Pseudomonadota bacterium]
MSDMVIPTRTAHARALLTLGLPLVGSNLAQIAITTTDTVMMGWYGVTELAGLAIAGPFFFTIFIFGAGFAIAVLPMVAAAAGSDDITAARRATRMGLWWTILFCAFGMIPMLFGEPILLALGQDPGVSAAAGKYLRIMAFGLMFHSLWNVLKNFCSALERTRVVLWVSIGTALLNVPINYALIFGNWGAPEMGIEGAGIASLLVALVGMSGFIAYITLRLPAYELFRNFHRPDWEAFGAVFRLGTPIGFTNLAEVGLFTASGVLVGILGEVPLAAHGIALQIASITFMVHLGLSGATTVRVGRFYGQKNGAALRDVALVGLGLSLVAALLTMACFLIFPENLVGAFVDPDEPKRAQILAVGVGLLVMAALFQLADAAQVMALGALRGVQDTQVPMIMAAISYWLVGVPASWVLGFPLGFGAVGVWAGLVIGLLAAGGLLSWRFWRRAYV